MNSRLSSMSATSNLNCSAITPSADIKVMMCSSSDEGSAFTRSSIEYCIGAPQDDESDQEEGQLDSSIGPYLYGPQDGEEGRDLPQASSQEEVLGPHPGPLKDELGLEDSGGSPSKLHFCLLCSFSSHYSNQTKRHSGEKPYQCPLCAYASAQLGDLQRHARVHTGEKPYRCPLCAYASAQLGDLQRHARVHTGEKPYTCEHGTFTGSSLGNLKRHQCMHAPSQCSQCHRHSHMRSQGAGEGEPSASTEENVISELTLQESNDSGYLQSCSGRKPSREARGLLNANGTDKKAGAPPELRLPFTCRLCGCGLDDDDPGLAKICCKCTLKVLSSNSTDSLGGNSDKPYSCSVCPFITHYPNHLVRHMKTHSGDKPYKCPQCDYASAHLDNLKRHQRVHTGEKPYECHLCDYACGNLANLKRHQRVHSGAKPFKCAVCGYSCNQSMNLKRHMLRHTGKKPFRCQECPYTTGHWDNYKRHQKKHGHSTKGWTKEVQLPDNQEKEEEIEEEDLHIKRKCVCV